MGRSDPSRLSFRLGLFLLGFGLSLPAALADPSCPALAKPMARVELVFGLGSRVSERAFMGFLDKEVTPRFPDGLSLFSGYGQWRDGKGRLVKEASRLLLIWYVPSAEADAKIEAIRAAYKKRFDQQSVLRADGQSCVSF